MPYDDGKAVPSSHFIRGAVPCCTCRQLHRLGNGGGVALKIRQTAKDFEAFGGVWRLSKEGRSEMNTHYLKRINRSGPSHLSTELQTEKEIVTLKGEKKFGGPVREKEIQVY